LRYWDASALVPLVIAEARTEAVRDWLAEDPSIITWVWTRVELSSAVELCARQGEISATERRAVLGAFDDLADAWDEVIDVLAVRAQALALLARHDLRAADAAQLGAALLAAEGHPQDLMFVCLDERLSAAADREGLRVRTASVAG
jgi:uncharacterized protein